LTHTNPIAHTYAASAEWAKLKNPPTALELSQPFKQAYKETLISHPNFRHEDLADSDGPGKVWWYRMLQRTMELSGRTYSKEDFDRFFLNVYQYFGSYNAYTLLPDVNPFLKFIKTETNINVIGVISNCPSRTVDDILPMLGLAQDMNFFVCAQSFGGMKPDSPIFQEAFQHVQFWHNATCLSDDDIINPNHILHVGDSLESDYAGAKSCHFQAALLNRKGNVKYNEWLKAPDYPGASTDNVDNQTYCDLLELQDDLVLVK
jgi:REG-2-like HAD superfamily hydrolase